jgi:hypothetical protein
MLGEINVIINLFPYIHVSKLLIQQSVTECLLCAKYWAHCWIYHAFMHFSSKINGWIGDTTWSGIEFQKIQFRKIE